MYFVISSLVLNSANFSGPGEAEELDLCVARPLYTVTSVFCFSCTSIYSPENQHFGSFSRVHLFSFELSGRKR